MIENNFFPLYSQQIPVEEVDQSLWGEMESESEEEESEEEEEVIIKIRVISRKKFVKVTI